MLKHILPKVLNTIIPMPGLTCQIYFSRKDIGSGVRAFTVIGVSSRYVTLYYPPKLLAIKVKRKAWPTLSAVVYNPRHCCTTTIEIIEKNISIYAGANMRYNKAHAAKAIKVLAMRAAKEKAGTW